MQQLTPIHAHDPLPRILPEHSVSLLAGAPGTGKSALIAWIYQQFLERRPIFGHQPFAVPFQGIICADRSWHGSTKLWFEVQGLDVSKIPAYSLQDDKAFQKVRLRNRNNRVKIFLESVSKLLPTGRTRFEDGSLIYLDPLSLFLGGNLLDYDTCLVGCSEIREICQQLNFTLIGTAHSSKQKADKNQRYRRLQDNILGSTALFGYTDTQMYLASPDETGAEDGKTYTFLWAPHHAKTVLYPLIRTEPHGLFVPHPDWQEQQDQDADRRASDSLNKAEIEANACQMILRVLDVADGGSLSAAALREQVERLGTPMALATFYRRLGKLTSDGQVRKAPHGMWERIRPA